MTLRNLTYTFPAGNATDICEVQTLAAAGALSINGILANPLSNDVTFKGYSRSVSISSANNLAARTFTVNGIQNGKLISEDIIGPNNATVYADEIFDKITSITVDGAAAAVRVGTGLNGFFPVMQINRQVSVITYTLTLSSVVKGDTVSTAVYSTLKNILNNGKTYLENIEDDAAIYEIKAMGAVDYYTYGSVSNDIYSYFLISLETTNANLDHAIELHFIQT